MRLLARLVLTLFVFFLATPSVVSVIKKSSNTSCFFNMSEEELVHKEVKAELRLNLPHHPPLVIAEVARPIAVRQTLMVDSFSARILIPPPETV